MVIERDELNQGELRRQAEELLKEGKNGPAGSLSEEAKDPLALVHELQVHQIELEMQNEELKRSRLEAEAALTRYSDLYDFAPIGLFTLDEKGEIKEINQAGAVLFGNDRQKLLGRRFLLFVDQEDRRSFNEFIQKTLGTSLRQTCELRLARDSGPPAYVRIEGTADGECPRSIRQCRIAVIDITERKLAEDALRETRDYLESLINYANAPIIIWDTSFKIIRFNHAFERLTGIREAEALGEHLKIVFPGSCWEESAEHIRRTLSGERWEVVEIPVLRSDGSVRTVLWNSANIYERDRTTIAATIAQGQDITERKLMEEALRRANDDLELKVQIRTADLVKARDAAEASANAKASFLANMSHELRTPMNYVIGFSSLLLDDNPTPDQKDYLESIRRGGEAMLTLINDMLEVSRSEKEIIELEHQPLSLRTLVEGSLDLISIQSEKKGLSLSYTIKHGTPEPIIVDSGRLRQILVHLLENAVKFTDKGEVSVSISSKALGGNEYEILFAVKDTGIGIPPDKMDLLFQPFGQAESNISRKRDGAGLGLVISKRLAELMGGRLWVDSVPGLGSKFSFTIKAEAVCGEGLELEEMDRDTELNNLSEQNPLAILVAEDNPSNQKVLVEMLKMMGYRPDYVSNGREVLQALKLRPYDLILMDVKMPEMSGLEATRQIRTLWPSEKQPYIVAVTAFVLGSDREMCIEAGMNDYIAKPISKSGLSKALCKCQATRISA